MVRVQTLELENGHSSESAGLASSMRVGHGGFSSIFPKPLQTLLLLGCAILLGGLNVLVAKMALVVGAIPFIVTLLLGFVFLALWIALSLPTGPSKEPSRSEASDSPVMLGDQHSTSSSCTDRLERVASLVSRLKSEKATASVSLGCEVEAGVPDKIDAVVSAFIELVEDDSIAPPLRVDQALVILRYRAGESFGLSQVASLEDALLTERCSGRYEAFCAV
ncbi:MAG: hypothetical protein WC184_13290 [Acidimicrobiia bacterium]